MSHEELTNGDASVFLILVGIIVAGVLAYATYELGFMRGRKLGYNVCISENDNDRPSASNWRRMNGYNR